SFSAAQSRLFGSWCRLGPLPDRTDGSLFSFRDRQPPKGLQTCSEGYDSGIAGRNDLAVFEIGDNEAVCRNRKHRESEAQAKGRTCAAQAGKPRRQIRNTLCYSIFSSIASL